MSEVSALGSATHPAAWYRTARHSLLAAGLLLTSACATTTAGSALAPKETVSPALETARREAAAAPTDAKVLYKLVALELAEHHPVTAYEKALLLAQAAPADPGAQQLVAAAALAMGQVERAETALLMALQKDPSNAVLKSTLVESMVQAGNGQQILSAIADRQMLDAALITELETALAAADKRPQSGTFVSPEQIYQVPLTDTYKVSVEIGGKVGRFQLVTAFTHGLVIDDAFAYRAGIKQSGQTTLPDVKLGSLALKDVPALIDSDTDRTGSSATGFDGIIGLDVFGDRAITLDRKAGLLTIYPAGEGLPPPDASSVQEAFYLKNGTVLTRAGLYGASNQRLVEGLAALSTGYQVTILDSYLLGDAGIGSQESTHSTTMVNLQEYEKAFLVRDMGLLIAKNKFQFEEFLAIRSDPPAKSSLDDSSFALSVNLGTAGSLGRDVISRYKISIDPVDRQLRLDLYPSQ